MNNNLESRVKTTRWHNNDSLIQDIKNKLEEYSKRPDAQSYQIYHLQNRILELSSRRKEKKNPKEYH